MCIPDYRKANQNEYGRIDLGSHFQCQPPSYKFGRPAVARVFSILNHHIHQRCRIALKGHDTICCNFLP
ncbi:hypothetical protein I308_106462 [Cryptococcus tetragattii IND107]|uniref:Uncharacterized protein n=1 Tax=Cryptococcus tetragattii IND107 TaxID=1296105 RepID=A0ABR3BJ03_9TREE